jgi:(2Fe-2S) ferredoxin
MSRRLERWRGRLEADRPEVVVCRGGDCGSRRKHPGFDHVGQLARFREELGGEDATVSVSKCLDACEFSNVVVVVPGRRARDVGAQPLWVGRVLDDATTGAVIDRVTSDDVRTEVPGPVAAHRFNPSGKSQHSLAARRRSR